MYRNSYPTNQPYMNSGNDDRQFFFPFLVGTLAGGAAVSLTRPRPVYVNPGYPPQPGNAPLTPPPGMNPYYPAGSYSYSYYYPKPY